jgi:hypothetical protein
MKTYELSPDDFDAYRNYTGPVNVTDCDGNIKIPGDLGVAKFPALKAAGFILAEAGTSVEAGWSVEAGRFVKAGTSVEAGTSVKAGTFVEAGRFVKAGTSVEAGTFVKAGTFVEAGTFVKAGRFVKAGTSVEAGTFVKAGTFVEAGTFVKACDDYGIYAGIGLRLDHPDASITCEAIDGGTVVCGRLVLIEAPKTVTIDGTTYTLTDDLAAAIESARPVS